MTRKATTQGDLFAPPLETGALFDPDDRRFRYLLWRTWDKALPPLGMVLLNPSTADETENDATISRCIERARRMGHGGLLLANLFAYRATDPKELYRLRRELDVIGRGNDAAIMQVAKTCPRVVCGWGNHGALDGRGAYVGWMLTELSARRGFELLALRVTKTGEPEHPLYLPYELSPTLYSRVYPPRECPKRPRPFVHVWVRHRKPDGTRDAYPSCRVCGVVQAADPGQRRGCGGLTRIGLREG